MTKLTKDVDFKPLGITLLSVLFLGTVAFIKYKPVYAVTVSGENLGYVKDKTELDSELTEYINHREGTIDLIDIANMPKYELELVSRNTVTQEESIVNKIEESAVITYKTYGITVNGEQINEVNTREEAENIISELQSDIKEGVEFELGIVEVYKNEQDSLSEEVALNNLNTIKLAKIEEYEAEQARLEEERRAEEAARLEAERQASITKIASAATSSGSGNISGINLNYPLKTSPVITSRFGASSSIRSSSHTGLDLAVALGTSIYPIASGTVVFSGTQGAYGKLIMIDHGDGVQSWYGHCNTLNVSEGDYVTTDTCIGTVGSTGNSTGPHLHLEIRINGTAVNPQKYLY